MSESFLPGCSTQKTQQLEKLKTSGMRVCNLPPELSRLLRCPQLSNNIEMTGRMSPSGRRGWFHIELFLYCFKRELWETSSGLFLGDAHPRCSFFIHAFDANDHVDETGGRQEERGQSSRIETRDGLAAGRTSE